MSLVQIVDFEVPYGLLHLLSKVSRVDKEQFDKYFRSGLLLNMIGGALGFAVLAISPRIFSFEKSISQLPGAQGLFLMAGTIFFLNHISNTFIAPLMAKEQFKALATYTAYLPIINTLVTSILVFSLQNPFAFMIAMLLDVVMQLLVRFYFIFKYERDMPLLPAFDWPVCKEILNASIRNFIPALSNRIGASGDKIAVKLVLGSEAMVNYTLICRIPQLMQELVGRITEVITPEMTHVAYNEKENFTPIFLRNFSITSGVVVSSVFVVSAFGESILSVWGGRQIENFGILCFIMAIYFGLESYHSVITKGFYSHNITHYLLPFTLWNSVITICCSKFLASRYGLMGIAGMNMFIDISQVVPLHWYAVKHLMPDSTLKEFLGRSMKVILPGILICVPIVWITTLYHAGILGWIGALSIPVVSLGLLAVYVRLGLVETTENFLKLMRKIPIMKQIIR
jgi:O-antigen/teichoic acid export membrane protein